MKGKKFGGRQKGTKNKKTVETERRLQAMKDLVMKEIRPMTMAQIQHAKGVSYMVLRHSDGTYARATDQKQIDAACKMGGEAFQIFTQAPNVQAFTDLMNRTFGKPAENVNVTGDALVNVPVFVMPEGTEIAIK